MFITSAWSRLPLLAMPVRPYTDPTFLILSQKTNNSALVGMCKLYLDDRLYVGPTYSTAFILLCTYSLWSNKWIWIWNNSFPAKTSHSISVPGCRPHKQHLLKQHLFYLKHESSDKYACGTLYKTKLKNLSGLKMINWVQVITAAILCYPFNPQII